MKNARIVLIAVAGIFSASVALMVAPVVTSLAGSSEAAEPTLFEARAQDCTDSNGDRRECTNSEKYMMCLDNVGDALNQCLADNSGSGFWNWLDRQACRAFAVVDAMACAAQYLFDLLPS